jgi:hypothetical protein
MQGFNGFWKWLVTPRSATSGTTQAQSTVDEARFSEQVHRLYRSLEEANQRARFNSRGKPGRPLARAAGSGIVRPV